jgi:hypothetical protein
LISLGVGSPRWRRQAKSAGGKVIWRGGRSVKGLRMQRNAGFAERQFRCVVCREFVRSISGHGVADLAGQVGHGFDRLVQGVLVLWCGFVGRMLVLVVGCGFGAFIRGCCVVMAMRSVACGVLVSIYIDIHIWGWGCCSPYLAWFYRVSPDFCPL